MDRGTERTCVEDVIPTHPDGESRLDGWRWEGVMGFDEYRAAVLAREAERASGRAA
jgi:hypothetical protein